MKKIIKLKSKALVMGFTFFIYNLFSSVSIYATTSNYKEIEDKVRFEYISGEVLNFILIWVTLFLLYYLISDIIFDKILFRLHEKSSKSKKK